MVTMNTAQKFDPINCFIQGLIETIGPEEFEKLVKPVPIIDEKQNKITIKGIRPVREKLDQIYGSNSARGIAICSGRAAFKHLLRQQESELGFNHDSFRFSPGQVKLKRGLLLLAKWMDSTFGEKVELENKDKFWVFNVNNSKTGGNLQGCSSMCDFTIGLLQEFMTWAGGGKFFSIKEVACRGRGNEYCSFLIDKKPIE
jgi:predicted hydrocarbon binding protein